MKDAKSLNTRKSIIKEHIIYEQLNISITHIQCINI